MRPSAPVKRQNVGIGLFSCSKGPGVVAFHCAHVRFWRQSLGISVLQLAHGQVVLHVNGLGALSSLINVFCIL